MKKRQLVEKIKLITAMLIVGSIGLFVAKLPLPRSAIALSRALIGTIVILPVFLLKLKKFNWSVLRKNLLPLVLSGAALGFNWMLLFEAFNHTSVQVATLCYYMAPAFVTLVSPFFLKERLTAFSFICTAGAVFGAVLISGVFTGSVKGSLGIFLGLAAAVLYASIIILNKKITGISGIERTFFQLLISAIVMLVYVLATEDVYGFVLTSDQLVTVIILGVVHTGIVYILFFSSISNLKAQTASILTYIDPVAAIILSWFFLGEKLDVFQIVGMCMIILFALGNELNSTKQK